jgi:hypothetical protein
MTLSPNATNAELVVHFGQRVWGHSWVSGMSHLTGINPRTLTRIHAAMRHGEDPPAARGVLGALGKAVDAVHGDLTPWVERADSDLTRT